MTVTKRNSTVGLAIALAVTMATSRGFGSKR